jgi:hypothetical protein
VRPAHALAAEAAVGRPDKPARLDMIERLADQCRNVFGLFHLKGAVTDHANAQLLVLAEVTRDGRDISAVVLGGFNGQHIDIECSEEMRSWGVGCTFGQPLGEGVTPAGVAPDLRLAPQALHFAIECLNVSLKGDVARNATGAVEAWFLDLDHRTACVGEPVIFLIQRIRECEQSLLSVSVELVDRLALDHCAEHDPNFTGLSVSACAAFQTASYCRVPGPMGPTMRGGLRVVTNSLRISPGVATHVRIVGLGLPISCAVDVAIGARPDSWSNR